MSSVAAKLIPAKEPGKSGSIQGRNDVGKSIKIGYSPTRIDNPRSPFTSPIG